MSFEEINEKIKIFAEYKFYPNGHYYTYLDNKIGISVTTLIDEYSHEFKAEEMAERVAKRRGIKASEVLLEWEKTKTQATRKGTEVHEYAQALWNGEKYKVDYSKVEEIVDVDRFNKSYKRSCIQADAFYNDYKSQYTVIKDELIVASTEYDVAGSIDNLLYNEKTRGIALIDYKTNKEIKYDAFRNQTMKMPLDSLQDCNYYHY
jgi:hypothetical protein